MYAYHIRYERNVLGRESLVHDTKQTPNQEAAQMLMVKSKKSKQNRSRVGEVICSLPDVRQGWSTAVPSSCGQPAYRKDLEHLNSSLSPRVQYHSLLEQPCKISVPGLRAAGAHIPSLVPPAPGW